ncbi:MAG: hypothetical protein JWQ87_2974, partial [Candidatus Sulfotelmatobacter sp.]|nr:hypothetical protein [Candidatus Sulfotelmatobacter sp.]
MIPMLRAWSGSEDYLLSGSVGEVERAIRAIPECDLVWARSRDGALAALTAGSFDLVILDRRI